MTSRGILFTGENVRAILAGRKTQTRRVFKAMAIAQGRGGWLGAVGWVYDKAREWWAEQGGAPLGPFRCPYGRPGDGLYVRETFRWWEGGGIYRGKTPDPNRWKGITVYRADGGDDCDGPWRPAIFLPRWASRINLEITDVRVRRVQSISEGDAAAEGCATCPRKDHWAGDIFQRLWDSINFKRGYGWETNPWVWALTFRVVT